MFGFWEAIYAYLSRMVGNRTDAADANGSLHAKIGDLKNTINTLQKPRAGKYKGRFTIWSGDPEATALDISGKGRLIWCAVSSAGSNVTSYAKIYIDGVYIGEISSNAQIPTAKDPFNLSNNAIDLPFKSSLKITSRGTASSGGGACYVDWIYELE